MITVEDDQALRVAAFEFLNALELRTGLRTVWREDVAVFEFRGRRIPLMPTQQGIRKPAGMDTAISFVTKFATDEAHRPYADEIGADGYLRYKWRGSDPAYPENVGMVRAMERGLPLIWFKGVARAGYMPVYPVWILGNEPEFTQFVVSFDEARPERSGDLEFGEADSFEIELRHDILEEIDGPTLRYALQGLHGESIFTPRSRRDKPDRELLAERFRRFRTARR